MLLNEKTCGRYVSSLGLICSHIDYQMITLRGFVSYYLRQFAEGRRQMKIGEVIDVMLGKTLAEQISPRWRPICRAGAVLGFLVGTFVFAIFAVEATQKLVRAPTSLANWLFVGFIAFWGYLFLGRPLGQGFRALMREGRPRTLQSCTPPGDGLVLRRMASREIAFFFVWCLGWNCGAFWGLPAAVRDCPDTGFLDTLVPGIVFPLIGLAGTGVLVWKVIQRCQPTYELRLLGGPVRENGTLTVDYRFRGNPEKVKSVVFVLASADRASASGGQITDAPGTCDDVVTCDTCAACTAGRQTFNLPKIKSDCHDTFDYYLRTVITFRSGLTATSTYRLPLN